jgi:hypothetical protein
VKKRLAFGVGALFAFGVIVACSSSDDKAAPAQDYTGTCSTLASQCHPYASKSAFANECHELGHAGDDSKCGPKFQQCQAECPITDASDDLPFHIVDGQVVNKDAGGDAQGDADAGPDDCVPYCACIKAACTTKYPYPDDGTCLATCHTFGADDLECWGKFCEKAKTLSEEAKGHTCDHALGKEGSDECPFGQ